LTEAKTWLRELSADEALTLTAAAAGGVTRSGRGKGAELGEIIWPILDTIGNEGGTRKPFDHPHIWSAFILIGDPD
jgi:CHAT domain-containing protein